MFRNPTKACLCAVWLAGGPLWASTPPDTEEGFPHFDVGVYAEGLQQPDGLALHPFTGELYVSEETAGRVSVIRNGHAVPVIDAAFTVKDDLQSWMITEALPRQHWLAGRLNSPEGIAFAPDGTLYVVEDAPDGRVLRFAPDASGHYRTATVLPVPSLNEPYAWESIVCARDGRLFLAGSSHEGRPGWGSSCVLTCDATQGWWMVDAGPLASFSAVALSAEEDILIAGDEAAGGVTWWDAVRQRELQTQLHDLGSIEGLCNFPDGSLAVAQENVIRGLLGPDNRPSGGRVLRVDPATGALTVLADGLGTLESVLWDAKANRLLVTEDSTGRILALTPHTPIGTGNTLLQIARRGGEAQHGLPPRRAPDFLKDFMKQVGVVLVDHGESGEGAGHVDGIRPLTLEELGKHVPLVAGRVRVEEMPGVDDPVTEVNFINLFPNQLIQMDSSPTPSVCLFAARHRSGRIDRSQSLAGFQAHKLSQNGARETLSRNALLMVPLATCSAVEDDNGVTVVMSFLGLNRSDDCFLTLNYGRRNQAYFATANEKLQVARASFWEKKADGKEVVNFAMTGVRARRAEDATWLKIGANPQWSLLSPSIDVWVSRWTLAQMPDLVKQMRRYNRSILDNILDPGTPESAIATRSEKHQDQTTSNEKQPVAKPQDRAVNRPADTEPPLASIRFPPSPETEQDELLTNLILSRIVQAWDQGRSN